MVYGQLAVVFNAAAGMTVSIQPAPQITVGRVIDADQSLYYPLQFFISYPVEFILFYQNASDQSKQYSPKCDGHCAYGRKQEFQWYRVHTHLLPLLEQIPRIAIETAIIALPISSGIPNAVAIIATPATSPGIVVLKSFQLFITLPNSSFIMFS